MTLGRYTELIKRLRYLDDYAKTDRHETTIFGQSADAVELLQKALIALENLAADQDREIRKLRGDVQVRGDE